jgi:hypothetical protein
VCPPCVPPILLIVCFSRGVVLAIGAPSGVASAGVALTTPCSSTKASVCDASCDLRLELDADTQRKELRVRIGRAVGKGGRIKTEVERTHRVRVRYFGSGKRAGAVWAISDAGDKAACIAAIEHIQKAVGVPAVRGRIPWSQSGIDLFDIELGMIIDNGHRELR